MNTYKLKGIYLLAIVTALSLMMTYVSFAQILRTIPGISIILNLIVIFSLIKLAKHHKTGFQLARNASILHLIFTIIYPTVINLVTSVVDGEIGLKISFAVVNVFIFTFSVLNVAGIGIACYDILKSYGDIGYAKSIAKATLTAILFGVISLGYTLYSLFVETVVAEKIMYIALVAEAAVLLIAVITAFKYDNKPLPNKSQYTQENGGRNVGAVNAYSQQTGYSTRDEIYRQFEGK